MTEKEKQMEKVLHDLLDVALTPQKSLYEALEDVACNNKVSVRGTRNLFKEVLFYVHECQYDIVSYDKETAKKVMKKEMMNNWDLLYTSTRSLFEEE